MRVKRFESYTNPKVDLPEYWYHGSNIYFDKFSLDTKKMHDASILGIYFSQYLKPGLSGSTAKEYDDYSTSISGGKPFVYKCKIHFKNPLILDSEGWYSSNTFIDKNRFAIKRAMEEDNHETVIAYDSETYDEGDLEYADFILVTNDIDSIEIVEIIEL